MYYKLTSIRRVIFCFFALIIFSFLSCRKEAISTLNTVPKDSISKVRKSTLNPKDIITWLKGQKKISTPNKNRTISNLIENLEISRLHVELFRGMENLVIIPLKENYFSQYIKNDRKPLQFLLVVEDKSGKVRRADMVLFYPTTSNIKTVPENAFHMFFTECRFPIDGTFSLVNLGDVRQYEIDFFDGDLRTSRMWKHKSIDKVNNSTTNNSLQYCLDWYLVTTNYYDDGHTEVTEEYLGTTCSSCPPNEQCDHLDDGEFGGGGGGTVEPECKQVLVNFIVGSSSASNESWSIHADYYLTGMNYASDAQLNYFTSNPISLDASGQSTSHMTLGSGDFFHTITWHHNYIFFNLVSNNTGLINNEKTAWANFHSLLTFPNREEGQGRYRSVQRGKNWPAAIILH